MSLLALAPHCTAVGGRFLAEMEAETPGAPQCMVAAGKRQRSDDTETPSPIDEQRPAKQSRPSPALLSLGLGSSCPGDDRGAALLGVGSSSSAPRIRPQETRRLRPIDTAYPRWICASKTAWKSIRASRRERRVAASADAQAAAAATAAAEVAEIEAAEAEAAENEAAVAAAAALAAPVSELETPIGLVQLGDSVEVKWSESDGDGKLYPATVVALTGGGVTVLYPETADWDEWEEQLAVEESECIVSAQPAPPLSRVSQSRAAHRQRFLRVVARAQQWCRAGCNAILRVSSGSSVRIQSVASGASCRSVCVPRRYQSASSAVCATGTSGARAATRQRTRSRQPTGCCHRQPLLLKRHLLKRLALNTMFRVLLWTRTVVPHQRPSVHRCQQCT